MINKPFILFIMLATVIFTTASCNNNITKNKFMKTVLLTEKNNGQKIVLHKGDRIKLSLNEAADAGYAWHFVTFNSNCLKVLKSESKPANARKGIVGGYNKRTILIETLKNCNTSIKLKEYRPWEGENKAIKEYFIKICIK